MPAPGEVVRFGFAHQQQLNNPDYGIKGYRMTYTSQYDTKEGKHNVAYRIPALAVDKEPRRNFAEVAAKPYLKFPPAKYDVQPDWNKT